jgi:hypothetical protein
MDLESDAKFGCVQPKVVDHQVMVSSFGRAPGERSFARRIVDPEVYARTFQGPREGRYPEEARKHLQGHDLLVVSLDQSLDGCGVWFRVSVV